MQLQQMFSAPPYDALTDFGGQVLNSILVGAVVAWILSLGRAKEKKAARAQVAEQLCRVFGMRFYRSRQTKKLAIEELSGKSLQGWASLERLQWNVDLHRADISTSELTLVQAIIEDLIRIRANQHTMELQILDEYLPAAAKCFLPPSLRKQFLEHVNYVGLPNLTNSVQ